MHAARFLAARGALIVACSNTSGAVLDQTGLPVDELFDWSWAGRELGDFTSCEQIERDSLIGVDCEILVPAARPDIITAANADDVKAKLIIEGANIPITLDAEATLADRGIVCLPDFIVNAGGVICAAVEYEGGTRTQAFERIDETVRANTAEVIERARTQHALPRTVADALARDRVTDAMSVRRRYR
jgi:glutamate dehydrogenase (NAD(P)+)